MLKPQGTMMASGIRLAALAEGDSFTFAHFFLKDVALSLGKF